MNPQGIGAWIRRRALSAAENPALVFRGAEHSYRELADRIDLLAAALLGSGVGAGDRVAFLGNNHPSFIESMFATTLVGGIFVPLNTRLAAPELAYLLSDSGASVLISSSGLEPLAAGASIELRRKLIRVVVETNAAGAVAPDVIHYDDFIRSGAVGADFEPARLDDRAMIIYTSGTTGRPRGAVLTHGNLTWNALNVLADYDMISTDRALMISPLFHVASLGMGCLPVLLKGGAVLLEERFVAAEALATIERQRVTIISGVPTTFQFMRDEPSWDSTDLSSLRVVTCGGSTMPAAVREAYEARGIAFSSGYGMTEASPGLTMLPPDHSVRRAGSSGLPHFFTEVRLRVDGGPAAADATGEIEARGPNVFGEYWNDPAATRAAFTTDGWLRTGDIGRRDSDGFLTIMDRAKDMIISGGENVSPAEVEQAILSIAGVTGAAVIGVAHERWGEVPHAVVTVAPGANLEADDLIDALAGQLAGYKIPRSLDVVDELPRTATGKVQKHLLRQRSGQSR